MDPENLLRLKQILGTLNAAHRQAGLEEKLRDREGERKRLLDSYSYFYREAWQWVDDAPLLWNWHQDLICEWLQALREGKLFRNMLLNQPPGSGKSINSLVIFPAWCYAHDPTERILSPSYDFKHVCKLSVDSRSLIESEWYQAYFGDRVQIDPKMNRADEWQTTAGGWRIATTPRGRATGKHPTLLLCFPADVKLRTSLGDVSVQKIAESPGSYLVLTHQGRYQPIRRVYRNHTDEIVEIRHQTGVLRCTGNHPLWVVGRGWTHADQIQAGEQLRTLRGRAANPKPKWKGAAVLRYGMLPRVAERSANQGVHRVRRDVHAEMDGAAILQRQVSQSDAYPKRNGSVQAVRSRVLQATRAFGQIKASILLASVPKQGAGGIAASLRQTGAANGVRNLRCVVLRRLHKKQVASQRLQCRVPGGVRSVAASKNGFPCLFAVPRVQNVVRKLSVRANSAVLLYRLRERCPLSQDGGRGEQQLSARQTCGEKPVLLPARVSGGAAFGCREGLRSMSDVQSDKAGVQPGLGRSSHRLRRKQQFDRQSDYALSLLPRTLARISRCSEVLETKVVAARCQVFNFEVTVDHTYWANAVLAHNCDDPTNAEQADANERVVVNRWWDRTISSRGLGKALNRRQLVVMQRLHEMDLTGHIKNVEGSRWVECCLPMEYEPDRMMVVPELPKDPRTNRGELLWPDMFDADVVDGQKRRLGEDYYGQYQQRPVAAGGSIFKVDRIHSIDYDQVPIGDLVRIKRAWDKAATRDAGCFTAGPLGGIKELSNNRIQIYFIDFIRGQWSIDEVESNIKVWATYDEAAYGAARYETVVEEEGGSAGKQAAFDTTRNMRGLRVRVISTSGRSKPVRWQPLANAVYRYEVYVVVTKDGKPNPNAHEFLQELANQPKSEFKDLTDSAALCYNELINPGFFDLPDIPDEEGEELHPSLGMCANSLCDRLARPESVYCCDSCEAAERNGIDIRSLDSAHAHSQDCNVRHGDLFRKGLWEMAKRI